MSSPKTEENEIVLAQDAVEQESLSAGSEKQGNPEAEKSRLEHERDEYAREKELFFAAKKTIGCLFLFGGIIVVLVLAALCLNHEISPWIISLGTLTLLVPTFLLACLFRHVYGKGNSKEKPLNTLRDTPIGEFMDLVKEFIQFLRTK